MLVFDGGVGPGSPLGRIAVGAEYLISAESLGACGVDGGLQGRQGPSDSLLAGKVVWRGAGCGRCCGDLGVAMI